MNRGFGSFCCDYYGKFGGISSAKMLAIHFQKNPLATKIIAGRRKKSGQKKAEDF